MIPVLKTPFKESFRLRAACEREFLAMHSTRGVIKVSLKSFFQYVSPHDLVRKREMCDFTDFVTCSNA